MNYNTNKIKQHVENLKSIQKFKRKAENEKNIKPLSDDYIKFIRCNDNYSYSTNDFRFCVYNHYLEQNKNIDFVFMTDLTDVTVVNDPFAELDKNKINDLH